MFPANHVDFPSTATVREEAQARLEWLSGAVTLNNYGRHL